MKTTVTTPDEHPDMPDKQCQNPPKRNTVLLWADAIVKVLVSTATASVLLFLIGGGR